MALRHSPLDAEHRGLAAKMVPFGGWDMPLAYPSGRDPEQVINQRYGTVQFPESYLIDRNGRVVEKIVGEANWSSPQMVEHVQSLL